MLRPALADRFSLVVRRETRDIPVYALRQVRSDRGLGPQLRESPNCSGPATPLPAAPDALEPIPDFPCGTGFSRGGHLGARGSEFSVLVRQIGTWTDRVLIDRTALTGRYDWDMQWTPEPLTPDISVLPNRLPLETALRDQLGFRLEPGETRSRCWSSIAPNVLGPTSRTAIIRRSTGAPQVREEMKARQALALAPCVVLIATAIVGADSWPGPRPQVFASAYGAYGFKTRPPQLSVWSGKGHGTLFAPAADGSETGRLEPRAGEHPCQGLRCRRREACRDARYVGETRIRTRAGHLRRAGPRRCRLRSRGASARR